MTTKRKNMVEVIATAGVKKNGMTRANMRISEELWANFDVYCKLSGQTRTEVLIEFIEEKVDINCKDIDTYKKKNGIY